MFSFITKFCLLCTSYTGPLGTDMESDGWVALSPVVKKSSAEIDPDKEDLSVWVLFSKQIGEENVMVRMPEDPKYHYISSDEMEMTSSHNGGIYSLRVLKAVSKEAVEAQVKEVFLQPDILLAEVARTADNSWDIVFRKDGKWFGQTYFLSHQHLYIFQTENSIFSRENHQKFSSSLDIVFAKK
jgi:hypothetical protein